MWICWFVLGAHVPLAVPWARAGIEMLSVPSHDTVARFGRGVLAVQILTPLRLVKELVV